MNIKRKTDDDYLNLGTKEAMQKLAEEAYNYNYDDFTEGESYANLEKRYQAGGQKAMQDTVGQVSARTGGLASSYATVAGQQTYNDWMSNLESAARDLYETERGEMYDKYNLANNMYLQNVEEERYNYGISEDKRLETQGNAREEINAYIAAGNDPSTIPPELLAAAGWTSGHVTNLGTINTREQNAKTLSQYMTALGDGVFVDKQDFLDAGGNGAIYDAYEAAYKEAKAKGEAEDKATLATNTLNTLIRTKADVDWDSEEIQQLIKDSGKSPLEWNALIAQMNEEIQADADAKAAEEIATAEASAFNDVVMYLAGGTKTLDELEASGMLASTGRDSDWWKGYIAYYNNTATKAAAENAEKFYEIKADDAQKWIALMETATSLTEAEDIAALIASASGNENFADELRWSWENKHRNTPQG